MVLMAVGPVALVGSLVSFIAAIVGVGMLRAHEVPADTTEARIDALTRKVRRNARIRAWFR